MRPRAPARRRAADPARRTPRFSCRCVCPKKNDATSYEPAAVERAAQQYWNERRAFAAREDPARRKFYCLSMLPYPSGRLHMGHVRNYTIGDVLSRYMRMQGYNVLQPMGWDAFGLPAENAAIANGVPPAKWTRQNIAYMRTQMQALGFAIDWKRELATCDPGYYRWNQWLFLRMLEQGIAYRKTGVVNWDPVDQTVLANEQVIDGRGWRTGAPVEKREIPMYYLNITRYADELLEALDTLPRLARARAHHAGELDRPQRRLRRRLPLRARHARARSGAPGAEGVHHARRHDLRHHLHGGRRRASARARRGAAHAGARRVHRGVPARQLMEADLATQEKKGMPTGLHVLHPLTGAPPRCGSPTTCSWATARAPSWGCPATMSATSSSRSTTGCRSSPWCARRRAATSEVQAPWRAAYAEYGVTVNSGEFSGLDFPQAVAAIAAALAHKGLGAKRVQYRLRDWGISRQRYWGCPIPIIHCGACGEVPVPRRGSAGGAARGPGARWQRQSARQVAGVHRVPVSAVRRRRAARNRHHGHLRRLLLVLHALRLCRMTHAPWWMRASAYWLPVDQYIGGIEHAILHLLYSRFWTKVMRDCGLHEVRRAVHQPAHPGHGAEPHLLLSGPRGAQALLQPRRRRGAPRRAADAEVFEIEAPQLGTLTLVHEGLGKMSKSEGNGVDPEGLVAALRRRHRAALHDVRLAPRADARVVGRGRGGRGALHPPPVGRGLRAPGRGRGGAAGGGHARPRRSGSCGASRTSAWRRPPTTSAAAATSTPRSPR